MAGNTASVQPQNAAANSLQQLVSDLPTLFSKSVNEQSKIIEEVEKKTDYYVDKNTYKTVIEELKNQRTSILKHFNSDFAKSLTRSENSSSLEIEQALNFHTDNLSLVTDSELEYQLKLEGCFSGSQHNYERCLLNSGWKAKDPDSNKEIEGILNCISPGFLALLVQNCLDEYLEDKQVARILYRFIGSCFFDHTTIFFEELISPLKAIISKSEEKQLVPEDSDTAKETASGQSTSTDIANNEEITAAILAKIDVSKLLKDEDVPINLTNSKSEFSGFSDIDFSQLNPDTQVQTASTDDISNLLRTLSERARDESDTSSSDIREVLKDSLKDLSGEGILTVIDKVSENILNLVSHLFEDLSNNSDLIDEVVCQISRIQASVMQVALTDSKMFQSAEHPVRQYINTLGKLGLRLSDTGEEGYYELRDSVSSLLLEFSGDISVFEEHSQQLQQYIDDSIYSIKWSDGSYDNAEYKNAVKSTTIQEFLESQQSLLNKELNFHKLLKMVWAAILAKILVRNGVDSEEWSTATEVYSSTLWSTQVSSDDAGKREILRHLPKIVQGTRSLFDQYGLNTDIRDALQEQMIQMHLQIIRGVDGKDVEESSNDSLDMFLCLKGKILNETESEHDAEFDAIELETPTEVIDPTSGLFSRFDAISEFDIDEEEVDWDKVNASDSELISGIQDDNKLTNPQELDIIFKQINRLPLDTIFDFTPQETDAEDIKRYRLSEKSIVLGKYVFSSIDSEETLEKNKATLALAILRGDAKRIEEGNIFDTALGSVIAQMEIG